MFSACCKLKPAASFFRARVLSHLRADGVAAVEFNNSVPSLLTTAASTANGKTHPLPGKPPPLSLHQILTRIHASWRALMSRLFGYADMSKLSVSVNTAVNRLPTVQHRLISLFVVLAKFTGKARSRHKQRGCPRQGTHKGGFRGQISWVPLRVPKPGGQVLSPWVW